MTSNSNSPSKDQHDQYDHQEQFTRRSTSTIPRWNNEPLLYHNRVRLVERLQVHLMNHIIGGENTKRTITRTVRDEWKEKWCNVVRMLCEELYNSTYLAHNRFPAKNDIIFALNQAGFQFDSYMASGFTFQRFVNSLMCYIFYLKHGIEVCKIPKQSYLHLERNYNINDLLMSPLTSMPELHF